MDRQFGVDMVRLGSRGMCREDAERVFAGQGEGEGGLLRRRELLKVLRLTTPHLSRAPLHTSQLPLTLSHRPRSQVKLLRVFN